ncbi:RloB domain-containing protein [Campylobacter ureolyticus]|uniref:RloB domain-containing protein n=1 Tax=Campylobacter ureolyticus TaxID=827 RepID=UPI0022B3F544|nr:RloB domain-containing protein [Campylobacter ureolyticus]MCZ6116577.1 RloB domain-containing protein [Campylobacter ureolyticus]
MSKIRPKKKIVVITEGQTEENYLRGFYNEYLINDFSFEFINSKSGNYSAINKKIKKYQGTEQIIFVVADLDRLDDKKELPSFEKMIKTLTYVNELCNIFLSYRNFETFLLAHFLPKSTNLVNALHKNGTDDIKNDKDIYNCIKRNNGCYENTIKNLNQNNICYKKTNRNFPQLDKTKITLTQSSLINLKSYCEFIKSSY